MTMVTPIPPQPLKGSLICDGLAWLIACSPLYLIVSWLAAAGDNHPTGILIFVVTCVDIAMLRRVGHAKPWLWTVLLPLFYLFFRSRALGKSQAPCIVWTLLVLALVGVAMRVEPGA